MNPVAYRMTYMVEGYSGRKETVTVLAKDVREALDVAEFERVHRGSLIRTETISPRWMDSDAAASPDAISETVLKHYAEKLGFQLVAKSA